LESGFLFTAKAFRSHKSICESVRLFRQHKNVGVILNKSHAYNALGRVNLVEKAINSTIPTTIGMGGS
jgi:hypothetical protein